MSRWIPKKKPEPWELTEEEKRKEEKIIKPYVLRLRKQLDDKKATSFWLVYGQPISKRFGHNASLQDIMKLSKKDKRLWGKDLVRVYLNPMKEHERTKIDKEHGTWITARIVIWPVDGKGNVVPGGKTSYSFRWDVRDFAISRFTFKLIEQIITLVNEIKLAGFDFSGFTIRGMVKTLKRQKIDISEYFIPLAGA